MKPKPNLNCRFFSEIKLNIYIMHLTAEMQLFVPHYSHCPRNPAVIQLEQQSQLGMGIV